MAKKVTGKQSLSAVRLTQEAKEKLCVIAERKCTTLGIAASRIILHYVEKTVKVTPKKRRKMTPKS